VLLFYSDEKHTQLRHMLYELNLSIVSSVLP